MIKTIYKYLDWGATIFGFLSGLVWIWALVYPGQAVDVLEGYANRFADVEASVKRTEEKVDDFSEAYLFGLRVHELLIEEPCEGGVDTTGAAPEFTVSLNIENQTSDFQPLRFRLLDQAGQAIHENTDVLIAANSWSYSQEAYGVGSPSYVCLTNTDTNELRAYEVAGLPLYMATSVEQACQQDGKVMRTVILRPTDQANEICQ